MLGEEDSAFSLGSDETSFRAVAARPNYLSGDRPDIHHAANQICRKMSRSAEGDWHKPILYAIYLKGAPRCVQCYEWQDEGVVLTGCSDSGWVGCRTTGKSTSDGLAL